MARQFYDEMYDARGNCRPHYKEFARWLAATPPEQLAQRRREADLLFHRAGITFTLYGDEQGTERLIPFDIIPRSIPASEWRMVERGCIQRVKAINIFLYGLIGPFAAALYQRFGLKRTMMAAMALLTLAAPLLTLVLLLAAALASAATSVTVSMASSSAATPRVMASP